MKRVIVNADDFGYSPGVNRGIQDAHQKGIVTSTTVMVTHADAGSGIEQALADMPDLGLGLHFNLTSGQPVTGTAQSLIDAEGRFYHIREWEAHINSFDADDLQREIEAQFERFLSYAGKPPDHLDAHHHATYLHPAALRTMLAIAARYNLPMRRAGVDGPRDQAIGMMTGMMRGMTADAANSLLDQLLDVVAFADPFWPARFESRFYDGRATLGDLLLILTNLPDHAVTEVMCHPGYMDAALAQSFYSAPREAEVQHLTHAATLECVESEHIQLLTFGDLTRDSQT